MRTRQGIGPRLAGAMLVGLIFVGCLAAFVPLQPIYPAAALDSGWAFALNVAVAKGLVFGRDIVFTFGPYAATYTQQYHPATDARALWSAAVLGSAAACGLVCLTRGTVRIGAVGLTVLLLVVPRDTLFLVVPFTFLLLACRSALPSNHVASTPLTVGVRLTLTLLVVALSVVCLVKETFALAAVGCITFGVVALVLRGHRAFALALALAFFAMLPVFWWLAGQPPAALPQFFIACAPIVSGYSGAMSIPGVAGHPVLFLACCGVVGLLYGSYLKRGGIVGGILLVGCAFVLFVAFKSGFVRQDWHAVIPPGMLAVIAWMLMLSAPRIGAFAATAITIVGWAIVNHDQTGVGPARLAAQSVEVVRGAGQSLATRVTAPGELTRAFEDRLSKLRREQPLPKLEGSVDVYSYGQSVLLARDPDWEPRPVIQSYSAYTPLLEALDAAHLTGASRPTNILFSIQPIDRHLPALEDGASWPDLLRTYDLTGIRGDLAVAHARAAFGSEAPTGAHSVAAGTYQLAEPIPLPPRMQVVWARIGVTPTVLGALVALLDKPPPLTITYAFADGFQKHFRYIDEMGSAGFLASPLIENTTDFFALESPLSARYFERRRPTSIMISASSGAGTLWHASFPVTFVPLRIPRRPVDRILFDPVGRAAPDFAQLPAASGCAIDLFDRSKRLPEPIQVDRFLRVVAWIAAGPGAQTPSSVSIILYHRQGESASIAARTVPRGNVAGYVDLPPLDETTYAVTSDLAGRTGRFDVGLEFTRGGRRFACAGRVPIAVGRAAAHRRYARCTQADTVQRHRNLRPISCSRQRCQRIPQPPARTPKTTFDRQSHPFPTGTIGSNWHQVS